MTSATQGANSWAYTFDGDGNRKTSTVNSAQTTYSYFTGTNRLQTLTGARSKSYSYDAAGNMTSDGVATWTFAGDDRPSQVVVGGLTVQFDINALGQRVRKSSSAGTTRFVYDEAGHQIGEYADDGTLVEETAWLGDLPVAVIKPDATGLYYAHPDHLGTPRMITRPSDNAIVWRWDNTEAFGDSQPNQDPSGLGTFTYNLRFPGQYYDVETGTNYNYFRDYDPSIGRYVESDPIGLKGGLNTYGYVHSDPLALRDPLALTATDVQGIFRDVLASFPELHPAIGRICFRPLAPGNVGETSPKSGEICVDPSWANKPCLTKQEFKQLFFTLFHEGMHSSGSFLNRIAGNIGDAAAGLAGQLGPLHTRIYNRELREQGLSINGPMWGTPRTIPWILIGSTVSIAVACLPAAGTDMSRIQKIGLVVVILAAVAAVLINLPPRGYRLDDKTKVQLDRVGELVLDWKKRQGRFPNDSEGLSVLIQSGVATEDGITDGWGDRLRYQCSDPQCSSALIYSLGPNKLDEHGGGDDLPLKVSR